MVYSAAFLNGRTHSNSFNHIPTGLYYVLGTLILRQWCKLIWFSLNQWFKDSNLKLNVIIFEKKIHVSLSFALFKIQFWFDSIFDILGAPSLMLEQNPCTLFWSSCCIGSFLFQLHWVKGWIRHPFYCQVVTSLCVPHIIYCRDLCGWYLYPIGY